MPFFLLLTPKRVAFPLLIKNRGEQLSLFGASEDPKEPGSRGGKFYRTETGHIRYGEKPSPDMLTRPQENATPVTPKKQEDKRMAEQWNYGKEAIENGRDMEKIYSFASQSGHLTEEQSRENNEIIDRLRAQDITARIELLYRPGGFLGARRVGFFLKPNTLLSERLYSLEGNKIEPGSQEHANLRDVDGKIPADWGPSDYTDAVSGGRNQQSIRAWATTKPKPEEKKTSHTANKPNAHRITLSEHGNYLVSFPYDANLVAAVKTIPGAKFQSGPKNWLVPKEQEEQLKAFAEKHGFGSLPEIDRRSKATGFDTEQYEVVNHRPTRVGEFGEQAGQVSILRDKKRDKFVIHHWTERGGSEFIGGRHATAEEARKEAEGLLASPTADQASRRGKVAQATMVGWAHA